MPRTLLFASAHDDAEQWRAALAKHLPETTLRTWPDSPGDPAEVDYALVWKPPVGMLKTLPNLRAIFSLGAGVDHLLSDPERPPHIPVVRLIDRCLTQGMNEYVIYWVIHHHRDMGRYAQNQHTQTWQQHPQPAAEQRRVGILGMGELGRDAAQQLTALHYPVAGWSRTPKAILNVQSFHGQDQLTAFLNRTDILVNLLPLTPETKNILNAKTLAQLPQGATVINAARGQHLVEQDLIDALDTGHLNAATLDVFQTEPLPQSSPLWTHPKIAITPHAASLTNPNSAAQWIAQNIHRIETGHAPLNTVDPKTGY